MATTPSGDAGWTLKTVAIAFGISLIVAAIASLLRHINRWPDLPWSEILVAATSGATYLALRHPESRVVSFVVFLPVCIFALIIFGPIVLVPLERLFE